MDDDDDLGLNEHDARDRRILWQVLWINLGQSGAGFAIGIWAASTAVVGAALDNLADASVYAVSIYAVGRSIQAKATAARLSGWLLIGLAALLLVEVVRRFLGAEAPVGPAMMVMAGFNAIINLVCLRILKRHKGGDVNFQASTIFTSNDSIVNLAILVSGALVMWLGSNLPDLVLGVVVSIIAARGGLEILERARKASDEGEIQADQR